LHLPGFVQDAEKIKAKKVDEIWCVAVNDAMVMAAWGKDLKAIGKVRMLGDGSAEFTKALGVELDLVARGMGIRSQRYSMLVDNGVVKAFNLEAPGKFEVSGADKMLAQL
jgi:peroxiredoxin